MNNEDELKDPIKQMLPNEEILHRLTPEETARVNEMKDLADELFELTHKLKLLSKKLDGTRDSFWADMELKLAREKLMIKYDGESMVIVPRPEDDHDEDDECTCKECVRKRNLLAKMPPELRHLIEKLEDGLE